MHKDIRFHQLMEIIRHPAFLLFSWGSVGLLFGTLLAACADTYFHSWMRLAVSDRVSIVCLLAAQLLPFLIAAYAVNISKLRLMYAVCSIKLFAFTYMGSVIGIAFGSAGWLVRLLFLFSDFILVPCLCWFCFRRTLDNNRTAKRDLLICIGICIATALIDYLFISPFLARIIDI